MRTERIKQHFEQEAAEYDAVIRKLIPRYAEDRPTRLGTHLEMLAECGFTAIDLAYKYYNYTVLFGRAVTEKRFPSGGSAFSGNY